MTVLLHGCTPPHREGQNNQLTVRQWTSPYSSLPSLLGPPTHTASKEATRINPPAMLGTRRPLPPPHGRGEGGGQSSNTRPRLQADRHEACHF